MSSVLNKSIWLLKGRCFKKALLSVRFGACVINLIYYLQSILIIGNLSIYCLVKLCFARQLGGGWMCVGIFSSLQAWLCVRVLYALQCGKNSVGSGRQSHGCLNVSRMSFRVTHNGSTLAIWPNRIPSAHCLFIVWY